MFSVYGFYDFHNKLIDIVPSTSLEEAKKWFEENYPDKAYLYIEVLKNDKKHR